MNTGMNDDNLHELAYRIWEAEGRPMGQAERHWQMAMEQALAEGNTLTTGTPTSGDSFLGEDITPEDQTAMLQDQRQYALQNNPLDETSQTTMEAEGMNTAQQPLEGSQPSEKIGGKRKAKAKSADTLADQDISGGSPSKLGKRKSSNDILA